MPYSGDLRFAGRGRPGQCALIALELHGEVPAKGLELRMTSFGRDIHLFGEPDLHFLSGRGTRCREVMPNAFPQPAEQAPAKYVGVFLRALGVSTVKQRRTIARSASAR